MVGEETAEGGFLFDYLDEDKGTIDAKKVNAALKLLKKTAPDSEEYKNLHRYVVLVDKVKEFNKLVKELTIALDAKVRGKYADLTIDEIKELLVNRKWYYSVFEGIKALYVTTSHDMANRIIELAERYEYDLPWLAEEAEVLEAKVKAHLERMGFVW